MREMKDSGVELFGLIPQNWTVTTVKREYDFQTGWTPDTKNEANFVGDNIWVNISDLKEKVLYDSAKHISDEAVENASMDISPKGSLLYAFKLSVGAVSFCGTDMYTNEAIATFLPGKNSLRFLYYIAPIYIVENANENIYGAKLLNQQLIQNAKILMPPIEEQERIANYLDIKCAKIDSIIEKQQAVIEKLKEYKLSVITEAVTKGLDNSIEMVPCDAGWTNVMPMGWISAPIKKVTEFITCGVAATPEYTDENNGFLFLSAQNVKDGKMDYSVKRYIVPELHESLTKKRKPRRGDILQVRVGATIGNAALVDTDEPYSVYVSLTHMRTNEMVTPEYFKYSLSNSLFQQKAMSFVDFAGSQGNLNVADMKKLKILVPTIEEQVQIVEFLNKKCDGIDEMISNRSKIVEKLQEYKKTIIYEVVTGKKEV